MYKQVLIEKRIQYLNFLCVLGKISCNFTVNVVEIIVGSSDGRALYIIVTILG